MQKDNLPDFIFIGPGRSGSTWIYNSLKAHPGICMAKNTKETCFFDNNYQKGIEWYKDFFRECDPMSVKAIGEVSNTYIYNKDVPRRIYKEIPTVKLITCLRNPIERIRSVYQFRKRNETISEDFSTALEKYPDLINDNFYWKHIQRYLEYFPREQIKILLFDELRENPTSFLKELYQFIDVDEDFKPSFLNKKINSSAEPRVPLLGKIGKKVAKLLRRFGMYNVLNSLKWNKTLRSIVLREHSKREKKSVISLEKQKVLIEKYENDIKSLMDFANKDLKNWLQVK